MENEPVSIPYRYATNEFLDDGLAISWEFQSLIGTLQTKR